MPEPVTLTDTEREALHQGACSRHRDDVPGVLVCGPCERAGDAAVEAILTARLAAQREQIAQAMLDGHDGFDTWNDAEHAAGLTRGGEGS